jgi:type I restriction-modification system DNA methylase subunit
LSSGREAALQDRIVDIIGSLASKYKFNGLEFSKVERDYPIDGKKPDIVLFRKPDDAPFLIIETKRKYTHGSRSSFQPLSTAAVGQAIGYVAVYASSTLAGAAGTIPFFATADPREIAIFRTPEDVMSFVDIKAVEGRDYERAIKPGKYTKLINECLLFYGRIDLSEQFFTKVLDTLAKDYSGLIKGKIRPGWAVINLLRSFVERVSEKSEPMVRLRAERDEALKNRLEEMEEKLGYAPDPRTLARMMSYVLMNKLIFYKVLEGKYRLPRMALLDTSSKTKFLEELERYFMRAMEATKDFEPIFRTGIYDMIDLPDEAGVLEDINDFIQTLESFSLEDIVDLSGYIYEELIPPEERHQLGQFYTPPAICELIVKWAIRSPDDVVFDPGCGSGGFLLAAYRELVRLKTGKAEIPPPEGVHEKIMDQLYGLDINPFPAHLTAVNIAMKDARSPSTNLNVIESDFFLLEPRTKVFSPYTVKTAAGEVKREIVIPCADAVVGNPPYTRWVEIPESTQNAIRDKMGRVIKEYGLTPQLSRGMEPGIYVYWIIHATQFLKDSGRLGMIVSNLWMQTDYGVGLGNFLLDHYRVRAVIDFTLRLFRALTSTCVILLEREEDPKRRDDNEVVFIHMPGSVESIEVEEILRAVEEKTSDKLYVRTMKQREVPRDRKWVDVFFGSVNEIFSHPLMTKLGDLFEPSRSNTVWGIWALSHGKRPDVGASDFAYLSPSKLETHNLEHVSYPAAPLEKALIYPAITSARDTTHFTFTEEDWKRLFKEDRECLMFIGHEPRDRLPQEVLKYIKWGEPVCPQCGKRIERADDQFKCESGHIIPQAEKCTTALRGSRGGGRLACETESARVREREGKYFYGWYDLGGVISAPIFAIRQARYKTRFVWCRFPVAMYDALISFIPKGGLKLSEAQIKALLAYLNSSFSQYHVETRGRYIAKGPIGLEVSIAREMPVLDVRRLSNQQLESLASLFDKLEAEARRIGGASEREQVELLKPAINEIDRAVAEILGMPEAMVELVQKQVDMLIERRVAGSKEESIQSVRGESESRIRPPKRRRRTKSAPPASELLDRFMGSAQ